MFVLLCTLLGFINCQHSRGETYPQYNRGSEPYNRNQQSASPSLRSAAEISEARQLNQNYYPQAFSSANVQTYNPQQIYNNQPQQQQNVRPLQQNNINRPVYSQNIPQGYPQQQYTPQQRLPNVQEQQRVPSVQQLDSRFSEQNDVPQPQTEQFTTRPSRPSPKQTTELPRPTPINRFNNYTTRKLSWDGDLSKTTEEFSLTLFAYLESLYSDQNIMIAPFTIHSLLVMISEGANGNTFAELNKTLGLQTQQRARDFHQYITEILK